MTCTGGVWVLNALRLGDKSSTCDSSKAGYLRYSGGKFEGCNGSSWAEVGSKLKVYKADGVTEVGTYIGTRGATGTDKCVGINYTDSTGTLYELDNSACNMPALVGLSPNVVVWTNNDCTGTAYAGYQSMDGMTGWCCTGSASCTSALCQKATSGAVSVSALSYREGDGSCHVQGASVQTRTPMVTPYALCGTSPCLVK